MLPCCTALIFLVCFYRSQFCSLVIHQTSLNQPKWLVSIHLTLHTGKISLNRSTGITYKSYLHELRAIYVFSETSSQCDKSWLRLLTGKKHPKLKLQHSQKIQRQTFWSLVHQINSFKEVLKLKQIFKKKK